MLPAADQLYRQTDFISQQDLAPAHAAKASSTWFKDHGVPVLNCPANLPDLKEEDVTHLTQQLGELKTTIAATWALITPE